MLPLYRRGWEQTVSAMVSRETGQFQIAGISLCSFFLQLPCSKGSPEFTYAFGSGRSEE